MFPVTMRRIRFFSPVVIVIALLFLSHGCGDEVTPPGGGINLDVEGTLVHATECKDNIYGVAPESPMTLDCVFWSWDGSDTLSVVHMNAGLNCCPGTVVGLVTADHGDIVIEESEGDDAQWCHCLCLYDFTYEISGVEGGEISITFVEPYVPEGAEILTVTIDLATDPTGSHCVQRNVYPWGSIYSGGPDGTIDSYSGCNDITGTSEVLLPVSADSSCVTIYKMDVDNTLKIFHYNTAYNCCVEALDAGFEFGEGLITITGAEYPPGGLCDCICLYDVIYSIYNLEEGIYTVRFVEPYMPAGQEQLEVMVDLSQPGPWSVCVPRSGYPWSEATTEEQDREKLDAMYMEIVDYIGVPECSGGDDCRYIGIGSKPCGGPWHYLVYSAATLDEGHLRDLVEAHAAFEDYMNIKYGYMSTCDVPAPPNVICRNGVCREAL